MKNLRGARGADIGTRQNEIEFDIQSLDAPRDLSHLLFAFGRKRASGIGTELWTAVVGFRVSQEKEVHSCQLTPAPVTPQAVEPVTCVTKRQYSDRFSTSSSGPQQACACFRR